jgi:hypothetical protein
VRSDSVRRIVMGGCLGLLLSGCVVAEPPGPPVVAAPPAPPAPQVEVVPAPPAVGYVWVPGHWAWNGRGYLWVAGRYAVPAQPGFV